MARKKPDTFMNCKICGKIFWSGNLLEDQNEMMEIMRERGGVYCEAHSRGK